MHKIADPLIDLKDISLSLGQEEARVEILKNVSVQIGRGEAVGIVGPSGSGKSTLLMILAGLERPDSGSVHIANTAIDNMGEDELAAFRGKHIGIVFQSFHLLPTMTALENVAIPLELAGRQDAFEIARRELESVGLANRTGHYPAQLSGGEQQRVALARAIAPGPDILIADEPTGNLDESNGQAIVELLFALQKRLNTTLVLVTHDAALAAKCDRRIVIRSGRIEATSAMHESAS